VNEFGAELNRSTSHGISLRVYPAANAVPRFDNRDLHVSPYEIKGRGHACHPGAYDDDFRVRLHDLLW
jgi:hypothetical protein